MPASRHTPVRIAVIAEAEADRRMVCGLIDRKIVHHAPDWFDRENQAAALDALREWCGLEQGTIFTRWNRLKYMAPPAYRNVPPGIRALGFGPPQTRGYDRASIRTALIRFELAQPAFDALVISRDLDGQHTEERRASLEEGAREITDKGVCLCLAAQNPMREAWLLNGFVPDTAAERKALRKEAKLVRFDPCNEAEKLSVADEAAPRCAKRVLRALTNGSSDREERCWMETPWPVLRTRGVATGLTAFLDSVKARLVQLVIGESSS